MLGLGFFCAVLIIVILLLLIKLFFIKKSMREILGELKEKLNSDTNTLICISSGDKDMRGLAAALNAELEELRKQKLVCVRGDTELKNAIANISHDIRTPLTAVCGYLDLLEREDLNNTSRQYLAHISNRADVMKQLTEELFRYSVTVSEKELALEKICINEVLEESVASFYGAISKRRIEPYIDITEKKVIRISSKTALSRIFSNIISNALKYSSGDLSVVMNEQGEIIFKNSSDNIDRISVERLFDRFYTVEDGNSSTGLGLSIAKALAERLGGEINAEIENKKLVIRLTL